MATRKTPSKKTAGKTPAASKRAPAKKAPAKKTAPKKQLRGSSAVEQRAHNPKVARSTRAPATTKPDVAHRKSATGVNSTPTEVGGSNPPVRSLTPKEELFVAEYLIDLNATQAYMRSHAGVKVTTASTEGVRLLGNPWVQAAIAEARAKTMGKLELTRERILQEVLRLALFDPRKMFGTDGRPLNVTELDDDTVAAIAGLEVLEEYEGSGQDKVLIGHVKKYKIADKNSALEKLMKHLGLFEKDNNQKTQTLADAFAQFIGQLHGSGAGRLPVVAPKPRQAQSPDDRSTLKPRGVAWK